MIALRFVDKYKLPEKYHKGKKIMEVDRHIIKEKYKNGDVTYKSLANDYNVSFGTIQCIINEDTRKKNLKRSNDWRKSSKYKKEQTMELRYRKLDLIKKGIIKL